MQKPFKISQKFYEFLECKKLRFLLTLILTPRKIENFSPALVFAVAKLSFANNEN
jgi:hypothetical protein